MFIVHLIPLAKALVSAMGLFKSPPGILQAESRAVPWRASNQVFKQGPLLVPTQYPSSGCFFPSPAQFCHPPPSPCPPSAPKICSASPQSHCSGQNISCFAVLRLCHTGPGPAPAYLLQQCHKHALSHVCNTRASSNSLSLASGLGPQLIDKSCHFYQYKTLKIFILWIKPLAA